MDKQSTPSEESSTNSEKPHGGIGIDKSDVNINEDMVGGNKYVGLTFKQVASLILIFGGIFIVLVVILGLPPRQSPAIPTTIILSSTPAALTPNPEKSPTLVPYGKSVSNDNGLRVAVTTYQRPLPTEGLQIPKGQELVLVTVSIVNSRTTGTPLKFAPEDFALVSPNGDRFDVNIGGITTGENLMASEVAPGENIKGDLIFYVYSDVTNLQLAWKSGDGMTRLFSLAR